MCKFHKSFLKIASNSNGMADWSAEVFSTLMSLDEIVWTLKETNAVTDYGKTQDWSGIGRQQHHLYAGHQNTNNHPRSLTRFNLLEI